MKIEDLAYKFLMTEKNNLVQANSDEIYQYLVSSGYFSKIGDHCTIVSKNFWVNNFRNAKFTDEQYKEIFKRWIIKSKWQEFEKIDSVRLLLNKIIINLPEKERCFRLFKELGYEKTEVISRLKRKRYMYQILCSDQVEYSHEI